MSVAAGDGLASMPLWLVCVLVFVAFLVVFTAAFLLPLAGKQRAARQARLDEASRYRLAAALGGELDASAADAAGENAFASRALDVVDRAVRARGKRAAVISQLERSGLRMRPEEWVAIQIAAVLTCGAALAVLTASIVGALVGGVTGWLLTTAFLRHKIRKRAEAFGAQLPDSLQLLSGGLRAGFALNHAIGSIVREGTEPSASEFGRVLAEVRLGAELEDALEGLAVRMDSDDLRLVLMAIRTSREVGGNLAEILDTTVATMRERVQLRGQVRVLSAEGRISAKVLVALPILMTLYLKLTRGDYLRPMYTTSTGVILSIIGVVLAVTGSLWLKKLTKIEV